MTDSVQSKLIISSASAGEEPSDEIADDLETGAAFELRQVVVPAGSHGDRLDRTLALAVPEFSRSYLQQLIEAGAVQLNGTALTKSSARVKAGQTLQIELKPTPQSQAFKPEAMALEIVFEDEHLLVVNKPAGLVVHPAPGNWSGTLLNGLLGRDPEAALLPRAGIVHRLDKDTSGLMVVARRRQVMDQLVAMIAARTVSREYLAL
ncbi:MAG: RluA family pseudouridine synthase, partial [Polaromonas sp.]|nr:RluA family pseudouridine synthase [Polaromonas sp.]